MVVELLIVQKPLSASTPLLMIVEPVYVFVPDNVNVPVPTLKMETAAED
jgi:hypothetical protein